MDIKYDQHFLVDKDVLKKIIETANLNHNDIVYEIGPGKGYLTKEILKCKPKQLISVEIDNSFECNLSKLKNNYKNFEYHFSDGVLELSSFNFTKLIANIPYAITEPLYKKILDLKLEFCLLLHGKTFYDTIIARDSKWNYFVNAFYDLELIEIVDGKCFNPQTKTKSVVVLLKLRYNLSLFDKLIQEIYFKKKRTTKNCIIFALVDILKISKKEAKKIYGSLEINKNVTNDLFENILNTDFYYIIEKLKNFVSD